MFKEMTTGDKVFGVVFLLMFGAVAGFWGCVVAAHDDHIVTVGECMVQTAKAERISQQEAWMECERNLR